MSIIFFFFFLLDFYYYYLANRVNVFRCSRLRVRLPSNRQNLFSGVRCQTQLVVNPARSAQFIDLITTFVVQLFRHSTLRLLIRERTTSLNIYETPISSLLNQGQGIYDFSSYFQIALLHVFLDRNLFYNICIQIFTFYFHILVYFPVFCI